MSTDKIQEKFQEWWRHHDQNELRASCAMGWAFVIWKASRKAIEVELPPEWAPVSEKDEGANEMRGHCVTAIESLGLKVKP